MEVKELIKNVEPETKTVLHLVKEMSKEDGPVAKISVEQRRLNPEEPRRPIRSESKPRNHIFFDVKSFIEYLSIYGDGYTVVYANPDTSKISAVLNETVDNGFEIVQCEPMLHPLWKPWEKIVGTTINIEAFISFLMQNRRVVDGGKELVLELSQINATTTVQLHRGRGKSAINGLMVTSKIQGTDKTELVELPESLTLNLPIFVATEPKKMTLDLTIEVAKNGSEVTVSLSSGDLLAAKIAAFEDMFAAMAPLKEKEMVITMGQPAYGQWEYLKEIPSNPVR